jgi:Sec-independent protein translocase protein TatA
MSWITDNIGMVVLFAIVLLVLLLVFGVVSGKLPGLLDTIRSILGV